LFVPTKQYLNSANAELARFEAALAESELAL
jgi:hypothetical protein